MTNPSPQPPLVFDLAARYVIRTTGGYLDGLNNPGGEARYGITKRRYPSLLVASLTEDAATQLLWADYWQRYGCHQLPPALGVALFDGVVLADLEGMHQPTSMVRLLQMSLRATASGFIDKETLRLARSAETTPAYPECVARYLAQRADFYHDMIIADGRQARHALGWFKRLFLLQQFLDREL